MIWDVIQAIAAQQHGLISRDQALSAGASVSWVRWAVKDGRLRRVRQGVYVVVGSASEHQPLMAACLAGGPTAAASHLAAAAVWGAEQVLGGRLEISTFDNRHHRIPGVITHRSRLDPARAVGRHLNLPVVIPPLTVVQVASAYHPHLVKSVANDLVKRHWTRFPEILAWIDLVGGRRQQHLRDLCLRAIDVGGHDDSPAARRLCERLIRAGAAPFEIDYQVQTPEGIVLIDIAYVKPKLGIEYNGDPDHDGPLARCHDARRRNRLAAMGWRMLDANRGMTHDEIVRWVLAALAATRQPQPQHPAPDPDLT
ncbi:MAG: type IV toxin-antitoxin system AbiEi family antitoxin domain-containing protein [Actinomycetota bacterium]|nr:type IV toxin-antitoxin system AbiEi family antitoxin domain-containing protein [Actinomycetota bacterium]